MQAWRVYYGDGSVVSGHTRGDWTRAPVVGVQVVVLYDGERHGWSYPDPARPETHSVPVLDRNLWTGTDTFDPFGWGVKRGSLIPDAAYWDIWTRACTEGPD